MARKPFSVRVTVEDQNGSKYSRTYERGPMMLAKSAFRAFALGDLIGLVTTDASDSFESIEEGQWTQNATGLHIVDWEVRDI